MRDVVVWNEKERRIEFLKTKCYISKHMLESPEMFTAVLNEILKKELEA